MLIKKNGIWVWLTWPVYFYHLIELPSPQPPSTTNNSTDPNHSNNNSSISNTPSSYSSNQHSGLPDWGIALIVLASVIVAAALGILAWAFLIYFPRKRRQRQHHMDDTKRSGAGPTPYSQQKQQEQKQQHHQQQRHQQEQLSSEKAESIYSDTPMIGGMVRSSVSIGGATTAPSSISQRHDSPSYPSIHQFTSLHSHDTINESLRQMIHRPDWTTTDEDIDEAKRRRLGEELLQRQLAEDGTMIKQTQPTRLKSMTSQIPKARTAIVVAESTESLSHSSSTTSLPSDHPPPRWSSSVTYVSCPILLGSFHLPPPFFSSISILSIYIYITISIIHPIE